MSLLQVDIHQAGYAQEKGQIKKIRFAVYPGEQVGLIGPNGAGKSTTMKAIMGHLPYMEGQIRFGSGSFRYAYIPEQPVYYEELTLWEHLRLAASLCQLTEDELLERGEQLLRLFRLDHVKHQLPGSFSKGMQQKLMIVLALLTKPSLYIIDEPFVGLDPKAMHELNRLLDEELKRGAGILMSTHLLEAAERMCHRFVLLAQGEQVAAGTLDEIRQVSQRPEGSLYDCFETLLERKAYA
mgnify:CR=1 FL=1